MKLDDIFYDTTGQEISTAGGFQAPCSPLRGCLKVNSDTMLPGQRMLIDEEQTVEGQGTVAVAGRDHLYSPRPGRPSLGN